jgi:hypothetical protein
VGFRSGCGIFTLFSHARAREALELGLGVADLGFKIFVVGEDSRGRMTAVLAYLERHLDGCPPSNDWVYLNNFRRLHRSCALPLPAGVGRRFRDRMTSLGDKKFPGQVRKETGTLQGAAEVEISALQAEVRQSSLFSCRLNWGTWLRL